jgi:hypothetical protein
MTTDQMPYTPEQLQRVETKLQAFYDGLAADEQLVVQTLLRRAAGATETSGYGIFDLPLMVDKKSIVVSPSDGGAKGTNPNDGKDGATIAGQPGGTPSGGTTAVGISIHF